jgi:hypothetical protein
MYSKTMPKDNLLANSGLCISCGSRLSGTIVNIGDQYPSAIFLREKSEEQYGLQRSSLNLTRCSDEMCTLVQLNHQIDLDVVYQNYPYQSGGTATMREILSNVVNETLKFEPLSVEDVVLDVGGNDGSLLNLIDPSIRARVNIDAAANIKQIPESQNYFYTNSKFTKEAYAELDLPSPKLIFCVAVFYQLHNPLQFCLDVRDVMDENTVFVLQMTYLESMIKHNIFDNIVHEHTSYYSLFSLENLLNRAGLKVLGAKVVDSYGGSLRVYISRGDSTKNLDHLKFDLDSVRAGELNGKTNTHQALYAFDSRFDFWKKTLRNIVDFQYENEGPIAGLGASTKGNMILQALNIDTSIMPYILDNNAKKIGSRTTGSNIPIIDEDSIETLPRNILNLPYYYKDYFVQMLKNKIKGNEYINLITPLSIPEVLRLTGTSSE